MASDYKTHPLSTLAWHRLRVSLRNVRMSPAQKAQPFAIVQAIVKDVTAKFEKPDDALIFFHIRDRKHTYKMQLMDKLPLEIFFFQKDEKYVRQWLSVFKAYLNDELTGRNFDLADAGPIEKRDIETVASEIGDVPTEGEICLEFITPFPFKRQPGKHRTQIERSAFIASFTNRFSRLFGQSLVYHPADDDFAVLPYYWTYTEFRHASQSQPGTHQLINGCFGRLYLKGRFANFLPFLVMGSELHTGAKLSNAQGYFQMHPRQVPHFCRRFPDKKALVGIIRDVIERYDHALESLSVNEKFPFKEDVYADNLVKQIVTDTYTPAPNTAFKIKKKSGADRLVEQIPLKDLIIQQYVLKTIDDEFERIFEPESIGFRKGVSRQKAVEMVQNALKAGYQYIIESDVEDFFPSVDLNILAGLIDFYLPQGDRLVKSLLNKIIHSGYILNGECHDRVKGVAQGSPLSPILANLFLDSFDEKIKSWPVRFIRYADDFIILTKTAEEAEAILSQTEAVLSEIGLGIKKEKTSIKHVKEGFRFLGMNFQGPEAVVEFDDAMKPLKKPLYITEPYLFLSLNADAVDVCRNKKVIESIPLRRVSEMIIMEKAVFSTALLKKCTETGIPFTLTLNSGYYISTVKPDSKKYFDIAYAHARAYAALTDTDILSIAKEFAAGKLQNYVPLFRQRYDRNRNLFIVQIERTIANIYAAADIHQVRGYEGAMAKKIYEHYNGIIENPAFHIKKRDRKIPDPINALLNFGYYLLFTRVNATLRAVGLNPYLGFLHSAEDNYESLVCDVEELFRARIDRFIISMINLKVVTDSDFTQTDKDCRLSKEAVKKFLNNLEREMDRKNSKNTLSLKESIYVQIMVLKKYFTDNTHLSFYRWQV
ncbi:MAG: CRISPR-associated endonuclease Cas1 [Deltaproteobacteria bacterium]|nr:CRISPR-associated endonuclease Cas1 [Deltaproteobacteria bacterium]